MVTSHNFSSLSFGHLLIRCALRNKITTAIFLIILLFSDCCLSASKSWVCWMTTARVTLLYSCWMSLNVFLMLFYFWCGDVTWLSYVFCLPWKVARQGTAPAGHGFSRWHTLDSSACYPPEHTSEAVQCICWSDSSSLRGTDNAVWNRFCEITCWNNKQLRQITGILLLFFPLQPKYDFHSSCKNLPYLL